MRILLLFPQGRPDTKENESNSLRKKRVLSFKSLGLGHKQKTWSEMWSVRVHVSCSWELVKLAPARERRKGSQRFRKLWASRRALSPAPAQINPHQYPKSPALPCARRAQRSGKATKCLHRPGAHACWGVKVEGPGQLCEFPVAPEGLGSNNHAHVPVRAESS